MCIETLKEKIKEWREWFSGDDPNSISQQIHWMNWNLIVFLAINEAYKIAPKNDAGETMLNGTIYSFFQHGFFLDFSLAVRKLLDKRKDVISLFRLIEEISNNQSLLTRKNILAAEELPYNYEAVFGNYQDDHRDECFTNATLSLCRHKHIDEIAGVKKDKRSPEDRPTASLFPWLLSCFDCCKPIKTYVNKFVAHAALPEDRTNWEADDIKITLGDIEQVNYILCSVAEFVGIYFLNKSLGNFSATPQFDQFEYMERPLIKTQNQKQQLHDWWIEYDRKRSQFKDWQWRKEFDQFQKTHRDVSAMNTIHPLNVTGNIL
jgi:hypothetical protein